MSSSSATTRVNPSALARSTDDAGNQQREQYQRGTGEWERFVGEGFASAGIDFSLKEGGGRAEVTEESSAAL